MCIVGEEEVGAEVFFNMGGGGAWQATLGDVDAVKSKRWG